MHDNADKHINMNVSLERLSVHKCTWKKKTTNNAKAMAYLQDHKADNK